MEKKVDIRSTNTESLSALDCLFRRDFSCKHRARGTSSCLAKLSSQMGGLLLPPPFFVLSISLSPSSPSLLCFILIYNLPETVDSHSLTAQRIIEGSIKGLHKARRIHREELLAKGPLMSHTGLGSQGLGTGPRLHQRSQFKLRERAKRITGNCISKGPLKKMLSRKKKRKTIVS